MYSCELDKLKIELKTWEHDFIDKNKREPTRDDIKSLRTVRQMYKQYSTLKKKQSLQRQKVDTQESVELPAHKKDHDEVVEIGPTPQVYGKAISIFDMNLSPIKPIYMTFTNNIDVNNDNSKTISNESSPRKTILLKSSPADRTLVAEPNIQCETPIKLSNAKRFFYTYSDFITMQESQWEVGRNQEM